MERLGMWKMKPVSNLEVMQDTTRGTIAGEGAAFFLLSDQQAGNAYAEIRDVDTFIDPEGEDEVGRRISEFLLRNGLIAGDIDILLTGMNGDPASDKIFHSVSGLMFSGAGIGYYKHLCGEYHTSSAFALWLAALTLRNQLLPAVATLRSPSTAEYRNIIIYNHFRNINHSLILVSKA
jgi:3-oxoacyl-(acyl-carrier-protein) synthase